MNKKTILTVGLLILLVVFFCACNFTKQDDVSAKGKKTATVEQVNHKITYDQVLQMRGAYKGDMKAGSFDIEQVRKFVAQSNAKYLGISYGFHDGKNVPILTIYDANKVELKNYALEFSMGCPPYCGEQIANK